MRNIWQYSVTLAAFLGGSLPLCAVSPGSGPGISFSPSALTFVQQAVGTTNTKSILISNTGTSILHITAASIDSAAFSVSGCPINSSGVLPPLANCELYVIFTPLAAGSFKATLSVIDDAPGSPQTIPVTATATGVQVLPNELKFRLVEPGGISSPQTISVTNVGAVPVNISSFATAGAGAADFVIQGNTCPQVLIPVANCGLQVAFAPTISGKASAKLVVTDNDPESPQGAILLGDGTNVLLKPVVLNFGKLGVGDVSPPTPIEVTNTGAAAITISSITVKNFDNQSPFITTSNNCPAVLAAGASCVVELIFDPEEDGLKVGQLVVTDTDPGSPQTAQLYGTGEF